MTVSKEPLMDVGLFICGRQPKEGCQEPNCTNPHVAACTQELHGKREGQACGRRMCASHCPGAVVERKRATLPERPVCGPHARAAAREAARRAAG